MYGYVFFLCCIDALEFGFPHIFFFRRFCKIVRLINIDLFHINLRNDLVCDVDKNDFCAVSPLIYIFVEYKKSFKLLKLSSK